MCIVRKGLKQSRAVGYIVACRPCNNLNTIKSINIKSFFVKKCKHLILSLDKCYQKKEVCYIDNVSKQKGTASFEAALNLIFVTFIPKLSS